MEIKSYNMKLNETEKQKFLETLKHQYESNMKMIKDGMLDYNEEYKNKFIEETESLKKQYEELKNKEDIEISLPIFDFSSDGGWGSIIWLILLAAIFGGWKRNDIEESHNHEENPN